MNPRVWLSVAFLIYRLGLFGAADQCGVIDYSVYGMYLKGHTYKTVQAGFPTECYLICEQETRCQSYNVIIGRNICELNSRTKEARPEDFVPDHRQFYMKRTINRVPLGSVQALPAESCGEIKASEGDKMKNGEYWIYSDGNVGPAILATCQDVWQKINTAPVCFGARDNKYGAFNVTKTGRVRTMKLVRRRGTIRCNTENDASYWGCRFSRIYANNTSLTIITNSKREAIIPPHEELEGHDQCKQHFYFLEGFAHNSSELRFRNLSSPLSLFRHQDLQIWYGQDFADCSEDNNSGTTCVDVYAWYI